MQLETEIVDVAKLEPGSIYALRPRCEWSDEKQRVVLRNLEHIRKKYNIHFILMGDDMEIAGPKPEST